MPTEEPRYAAVAPDRETIWIALAVGAGTGKSSVPSISDVISTENRSPRWITTVGGTRGSNPAQDPESTGD